MSFQHKNIWTPRDTGCLTDGEMGYDNSSRIEPKRGHQWFMDTTGPEFFSNKKQAIETVNGRPITGISDVNISPWENTSSFPSVSGPFTDRLFGSEPARAVNLVGTNNPSGNLNIGRKGFEGQYGNDPSVGLTMSHTVEDPSSSLSFGGIRRVKVNRVRDSDNGMSVPMGLSYSRGDNSTISSGITYSKSDNNTISLGPTYNNGDQNTVSIGPTFGKADDNFILMGHTYNKGDGNFTSVGLNYNKEDENMLSMGQPFNKGDSNFISVGQSFGKGDTNVISMAPSYTKSHEHLFPMGPTYSKPNETFISMAPSYKGNDNIISIDSNYDKANSSMVSNGPAYDKGDSSIVSVGHNYNKGEGNTISFGGFHDEPETNPSGGIIGSYDLLMSNQNIPQALVVPGQKDLVESSADPVVNSAPKSKSKTDTGSKMKEPKASKKIPPNNFPSNVKSLLSTGMFDGVAVKYVSWSREKNLRGIIKETGYLCGCKDCQFSKSLNAYEFERHAGCKTKHPNNHIYFENGKTIYSVVQELKNTPQEMLFEAIQTVTGSTINQKNFTIWRVSYQAAARELQRIYGKDEIVMPS